MPLIFGKYNNCIYDKYDMDLTPFFIQQLLDQHLLDKNGFLDLIV